MNKLAGFAENQKKENHVGSGDSRFHDDPGKGKEARCAG